MLPATQKQATRQPPSLFHHEGFGHLHMDNPFKSTPKQDGHYLAPSNYHVQDQSRPETQGGSLPPVARSYYACTYTSV